MEKWFFRRSVMAAILVIIIVLTNKLQAGQLIGQGVDFTGNPQKELVIMPDVGIQNGLNVGSSVFYRNSGLIALADLNFSYNPIESWLWAVIAGPAGFYGQVLVGFEPGSGKLTEQEEKWILSANTTHSGNTTTYSTTYHTYKIPEQLTLSPSLSIGIQPWPNDNDEDDYLNPGYKMMFGLHLLGYNYYDVSWTPTDERSISAGAYAIKENKKRMVDIGLVSSMDFSVFGFKTGTKTLNRDEKGVWSGSQWDFGIYAEGAFENFYALIRYTYLFSFGL